MRSPTLMSRGDSGLLVIDLQEKLMPVINNSEKVLVQTILLVEGAKILGLPVLATEQYPKGLGPTVSELSQRIPKPFEKLTFSCAAMPEVVDFFRKKNVGKILLAGVEAHVCVLQTALDLMNEGFKVFIAVDAVGSRQELDRETALKRMQSAGVVLTTAETALFEWAEKSGTPEFKLVSRLVVKGVPKSAP